MIYLDYNATTPLTPNAKQAMIEAFECLGNPSSVHKHGREVRKLLENAREKMALFFNLPARNVTFTSGATEANNLMVKGCKGPVLVSTVEHDSILSACDYSPSIPVDSEGVIQLDKLDEILKKSQQKTLVCIIAVNNETGVVQPISEILTICQKHAAHLHVDAAQAVGKTVLDWKCIPSFTISAHKFGGPKGMGALIINDPIDLSSLISGGGQEKGLRAGTENIIGAVGMAAAINTEFKDLKYLQTKLEEGILNTCKHATIFGSKSKRSANTTAVAMPSVASEVQLMHFDLNNISISSGAACSSGKVKTSHVLKAMGVPESLAKCAIRISTGWNTTEHEIDQCLAVWQDLFYSQQLKQNVG